MILSGQSIRDRNLVSPFYERATAHGMTYGLGPAGYDIRIAQEVIITQRSFKLASSIEKITMPHDLLGRICDKSSWARKGLSLFNTVIEPGWAGYLTLELVNNSDTAVYIKKGTPIAQVIFELVDVPVERPYRGKYQNQPARPVEAIMEGNDDGT